MTTNESGGDPLLRALRDRGDRAIRLIVEALGEGYGFGRVALIARKVWAEREPDFEKLHRDMDLAGRPGKKTVGGTLTGETEGGPI